MAAPIPIILAALGMKFGGDAIQQGRQRKAMQQRGREAADLVRGAGFGAGLAGPTVKAAEQGIDLAQLGGIQRNIASLDPNIQQTAIEQLEAITPMNVSNALAEKGRQDIIDANVVQKQIFDQEKALRTDYNRLIEPAINSQNMTRAALSQIQLEGNPLRGLQALRAWYKQIDSSMVTSPEIAAAIDQFGVSGAWATLEGFINSTGPISEDMLNSAINSMVMVDRAMQEYGNTITQRFTENIEEQNKSSASFGSNVILDPTRVTQYTGYDPAVIDLIDRRSGQNTTKPNTATITDEPGGERIVRDPYGNVLTREQ